MTKSPRGTLPALALITVLAWACRNESATGEDSSKLTSGTSAVASSSEARLETSDGAAPEVEVIRRDAFVDVALRLDAVTHHAGGLEIRAVGSRRGSPLALRLASVGAFTPVNVGADVAHVICRGGVVLTREGGASDALLRTLDEVYETKLAPRSLSPSSLFSATAPCDAVQKPGRARVELALARTGAADEIFELTVAIDELERRLKLRERDPAHRPRIVRALTGR